MTITFNGKSFYDFGTYYDGSKLYGTPQKEVEFFAIPGRSGDLSVESGRYSNIVREINCFIREDFKKNYPALLNYLYSQNEYGRLQTSTEPDVFMLAQFVEAIEPETGAFLKYGSFALKFNCKPQKYLLSGEQPIEVSSTATLINPTEMPAKPLLICVGTGDITINDTTITLSANTSEVYIDCDIQDAWEGTINRNPDISLTNGFPVLGKENTVSVSGMTVQIIPRWWRL